jgi:hypothetical protein
MCSSSQVLEQACECAMRKLWTKVSTPIKLGLNNRLAALPQGAPTTAAARSELKKILSKRHSTFNGMHAAVAAALAVVMNAEVRVRCTHLLQLTM